MVDIRPNLVDNSADGRRLACTPSAGRHRVAQTADSTGLVGSRGRGSPPAERSPRDPPIPDSHLSERLLFHAYGIDTEELDR